VFAELLGMFFNDLASLWQSDAKGSKWRAWLILLSAVLVSAVLALIVFTDVL
jgi:hypothetical protein